MAPAAPAGAGLLTRVVGGLRYAVTGTPPAPWFGPSAPLSPEAPASVAGRQFDYPVGFNLRLQPRQDEGTGFAELRGLADAYDLVRLVIETRKDQVEALDWTVRARDGSADPRLAAVEALFRNPDREHGWGAWLRMLLEDLFVLDAPTLYVRRTASGALWGLEVIDGATIKRLLGPDGRTPPAPDPAYQQVLKGVPAVDYSADELIYAPRNPRPHRVYGYSPVEQILMTVNIGLRRQVSQLNYFTEGNTPEALIGVPEAWAPEQIRQFQEYWDALLEGNLAARRHTRFVPGGLKYQPTRDVPLKDEFDEWLARVVCFAFSIPPTAFAKETNRATAETALGTALAEGLQPLMVWLKGLMDRILADVLGWPDLEFAWSDRTAPDPQAQATIAQAYVAAGIKTRNEVRAELGLDPVPGGDVLTTASPAAPLPAGLAKFNFNQIEPRDRHGRWIRVGFGADARLVFVAEDEETPDEREFEEFREASPQLQRSILDAGSPERVARLMADRELAETHYQYLQAQAALREVDPQNPLLTTLQSPEWLPNDRGVRELRDALQRHLETSKETFLPNIYAETSALNPVRSFETTDPVSISGRNSNNLGHSYERAVRALYGDTLLPTRQFFAVEDDKTTERVADGKVSPDGVDAAMDAKFVEEWERSLRNPDSPRGKEHWAQNERDEVVAQARRYSQNFPGGVIYHTNSLEFAEHYCSIFDAIGGIKYKFIITPAEWKKIMNITNKILGQIKKRDLPGKNNFPEKETVYFSDSGKGGFSRQFRTLVKQVPLPWHDNWVIAENTRIQLPDGEIFYGISCLGELDFWEKHLDRGAEVLKIFLGAIRNDNIVVSDGRTVPLADCKIDIDIELG